MSIMAINAFHIFGRMDASIICRLDSVMTFAAFRLFKLSIVRQTLYIAMTVHTADIAMMHVFVSIMAGVTGV